MSTDSGAIPIIVKPIKSYIIFLKGITLSDLQTSGKTFTNFLMGDVNVNAEVQAITYDKIPDKFTTVDKWPKVTNLRCWHCSRLHNEVPKFVAYKNINSPIGSFCDWPCGQAWINKKPLEHRWEMEQQFRELHYLFTGQRIKKILPALDKEEQVEYGGSITKAKYIKHNKELYDMAALIE